MVWLPLFSLIFLMLIYRVHRLVFWIVGILEITLYTFGVIYIEETFTKAGNQFLYYLALTGAGLIIGVAGFFFAISINHRHLYDDLEIKKETP
ncbi:hypothetical protein KBC86_01175 [Candidatus Gracilibacteria bacterium]|nr:hypothetical protein [Candidatus Gracilibacteria bacterium]